jgi:hypothetical protein
MNNPIHKFKTVPDNYIGINTALHTNNLYAMDYIPQNDILGTKQ